jgi:hypothetical protein
VLRDQSYGRLRNVPGYDSECSTALRLRNRHYRSPNRRTWPVAIKRANTVHRRVLMLGAIKQIVNETLFRRLTPPVIQDLMMRWGKRTLGTRFIPLACLPKSGSTFISRTMHELPGFAKLSAVPIHDRREQELERESIRNLFGLRNNVVYQHHVRHSAHLEHLISDYNMHVVVITRDLTDVCQSISDHLDSESLIWFNAFLDEATLKHLDRTGNELAIISSIINEAGLEVTFSELQMALDKPRFTRLNVGKVGRGKEFLRNHPEATDTLERYLSYYPEVDFTSIYDPTQ